MANPFTIEIFATSGDPQGIRIIRKSNWSGVAIVFPKELTDDVIKEEFADRPGVYVLVGDLAEETVYIGEADPVSVRLKQQLNRDWSWVSYLPTRMVLVKQKFSILSPNSSA